MVIGAQFHKFHDRPFARVLYKYVFLVKDIGRATPLGACYLVNRTIKKKMDVVVHNHSAHVYHITRIDEGVRYA